MNSQHNQQKTVVIWPPWDSQDKDSRKKSDSKGLGVFLIKWSGGGGVKMKPNEGTEN